MHVFPRECSKGSALIYSRHTADEALLLHCGTLPSSDTITPGGRARTTKPPNRPFAFGVRPENLNTLSLLKGGGPLLSRLLPPKKPTGGNTGLDIGGGAAGGGAELEELDDELEDELEADEELLDDFLVSKQPKQKLNQSVLTYVAVCVCVCDD